MAKMNFNQQSIIGVVYPNMQNNVHYVYLFSFPYFFFDLSYILRVLRRRVAYLFLIWIPVGQRYDKRHL